MSAAALAPQPARRLRRFAPLALAVVALSAIAPTRTQASPISAGATESFTTSMPLTPTDWSPGVPATATNPLSVPKFDPSLGTLKSVTLSMGYSIQNDFSMSFLAPASITVTATDTALKIDRPDMTTLLTANVADVSKSQDYSGPGYPHNVSFPSLTRGGTTSPLTLSSAADLALFTATTKGQTLGLPAFATAKSSFSTSTGNGQGVVNTKAGTSVTVTYNYTPVPEPATLAVVTLGLLTLVVTRRPRA